MVTILCIKFEEHIDLYIKLIQVNKFISIQSVNTLILPY